MLTTARPVAALTAALRRAAALDGDARLRIGLPVASVLVAVLLVDLLRPLFPAGGVFLVLLVPILVTSVAAGAGAGLLALLLGVAGAVFVAAFRGHSWFAVPADLLRIVPYLFIGGFAILTGELLRTSISRRLPPVRPPEPPALVEPLTGRETEILGLVASGLTTEEAADYLCLSRNTVKSHLNHAYGKLGARNRAEAVAIGLHTGAIDRGVLTSRAEGAARAGGLVAGAGGLVAGDGGLVAGEGGLVAGEVSLR